MTDFLKTRRDFLRTSVLGASAAWTVPAFVGRTFAEMDKATRDLAVQAATGKDGPILVVVQLAGGNDGLNTVVPYGDDAYHKARPRLAKEKGDLNKLNDYVGLNKAMPFMNSLYDEGDLAIVQGVGYPNPNRSHFISTSIWETADPTNRSNTGWLGRYFDNACDGCDPTVGVSFNKTQPESFGAEENPGICLSTPELYRWIHGGGQQDQAEEFFADLNQPSEGSSIDMPAGGKVGGVAGEDNLAFLERVSLDARVSSAKILELASKHKNEGAVLRHSDRPQPEHGGADDRREIADAGLLRQPRWLRHPQPADQLARPSADDAGRCVEGVHDRPEAAGERRPRDGDDVFRVRPAGAGECEFGHRPRQGLVFVRGRQAGEGRALRQVSEPDRPEPGRPEVHDRFPRCLRDGDRGLAEGEERAGVAREL
jgi:hypothetical protein